VGVYAGSDANTAHDLVVDYAFNAGDPISPEDGNPSALHVSVVGQGSVTRLPDQSSYTQGEIVELTPVPAPGWSFQGWSGDATGSDDPLVITLGANTSVTATFVDAAGPVISNIQVATTATSAVLSFDTDEVATATVDWGPTISYGATLPAGPSGTAHQFTLIGLSPDTTYHLIITASDASANVSFSPDVPFTTAAPDPGASGFVSDDFSGTDLDTGIWTFVNPLGDASAGVAGTELHLSIPADPNVHDFWVGSDTLPRLEQSVADADLDLEVGYASGFDSPSGFQSRGLLFQQADGAGIRIEMLRVAGADSLFTASIIGGTGTVLFNLSLAPLPSRLRVIRSGDDWTVLVSDDGVFWQDLGTSFTLPFALDRVGVYAGSGADTAHDLVVDYVFNAGDPISPEDGNPSALQVSVTGQGTVTRNPDKVHYGAGEVVELTPVPDPGWSFQDWSGDASGSDDPLVLTLGASTSVTANFVDTVAPVISNVQVTTTGPTTATVSFDTDEPALASVDFGPTTAYGTTLPGSALATSHSFDLVALNPGASYHLDIAVVDGSGNAGSSGDIPFSAGAPDPGTSGLVSDDFSGTTLDTGPWTFVNPLGDAWAGIVGNELHISIPDDPNVHDFWVGTDTVPRLVQAVSDTDVEVEVGYLSTFDSQNGFQSRGLLFQQANGDGIRIEMLRTNSMNRLYVASIIGGVAVVRIDNEIGIPNRLRVIRSGDAWTVLISQDGVIWNQQGTFTLPFNLASVAVYAGSDTDTSHDLVVDYAFNSGAPIAAEDANPSALHVAVVGQGSVARVPDQALYTIGEDVQLTANPGPGWFFAGWQGDVVSANPVLDVNLAVETSVSAVFLEKDVTPPVISNVTVTTVGDDSAIITWTTDEPTTSQVDYGPTSAYGSVESDPTLVLSHTVALTGLAPDTLYHFSVTSADAALNSASSGDGTFTTLQLLPGPVTDDFDGAALDPGVWTFVNPFGVASASLVGGRLQITIPPNPNIHDTWVASNDVARVMQTVADVDFEVEAKFDTPNDIAFFSSQGIQVAQDPNDVLRIETLGANGVEHFFVASIFGSSVDVHVIEEIDLGTPRYLRVTRAGDEWTVRITDGTTTRSVVFTQPMVVTGVGVYAGSEGTVEHTVHADYFLETSDPFNPSGIVSDDFTGPAIDGSVWTFTNPFGAASATTTGTQAAIAIPPNPDVHVAVGANNDVARLMQPAADVDFQVVAKLDSDVLANFTQQGIQIAESPSQVLHVAFTRINGVRYLVAVGLFGGTTTLHVFGPARGTAPTHLRVTRSGDTFSVSYSRDGGLSWLTPAPFDRVMTVTEVGFFAGAAANTPHTTLVDYFFDPVLPVVPED
jgi:hypothetical protein